MHIFQYLFLYFSLLKLNNLMRTKVYFLLEIVNFPTNVGKVIEVYIELPPPMSTVQPQELWVYPLVMIYQLIHHHFHCLHLRTPERKANPSLSLLTYALDKLATATTIAPLIWQYYSNSNLSLNFKAYISTSINTFWATSPQGVATSPQGVKRAAPLECQRICFCKKSVFRVWFNVFPTLCEPC